MNRMILCASQAATGMDEPSSSSSIQLDPATLPCAGRGRSIDRYNPIITDSRRIANSPPPSSPLPPTRHKNETKRKTRIEKPKEQKRNTISSSTEQKSNAIDSFISRNSWSCTKPGNSMTPPGSSRYLLSDEASVEKLLDIDPPLKLKPDDNEAFKLEVEKSEESVIAFKKLPEQVVVLRVSLHCKGCEKKMRKHISKMQGVTSFNIDFAAQKVIVAGEISPSDVLASISKVKNAKLWTPLPQNVLQDEAFRP